MREFLGRLKPRRIADWVMFYIAVVVTVLGVLVLNSIGTNAAQNRKLAEQAGQIAAQARRIGQGNYEAAIAGCHRGNFLRSKVNVVSRAVAELIEKQVESAEEVTVLTPAQLAFVRREYRLLRPLAHVNCATAYPEPSNLAG